MKRSGSPNNVLACLLVCGSVWLSQLVLAGPPRAGKGAPPAAPAKASAAKEFSITVQGGWRKTDGDAWQDAVEQAQDAVTAYLREWQPSLEWTPSVGYIERRLLKESKPPESKEFDAPVGTMLRRQMRIEGTAADRTAMLNEARQVVAERRLALAGKLLAGLVACLVSITGYLRLEERTHGYYTGRLRLITVGFLAAVGLAFWLLA